MKRQKILKASVHATPSLERPALTSHVSNRPKTGIKVESGCNRLQESTKLDGVIPIDFKVSGIDTAGDLSVFVSSNNLKNTGPALHVHPDLDEVFYILEGELKFKVGEDIFDLKPGDSIFLPRQIPHAFTITSDTPGKFIVVVQPAGKLEEFFRSRSQIGTVTPDLAFNLMTEHNMKVVGPPLALH